MKLLICCLLSAVCLPAAAQTVVLLPHAAVDLSGNDARAGVTLAANVWQWESWSLGPALTVADTGTSDPLMALELRAYWRKPITESLSAFTFCGGGYDGIRHYEAVFSSGFGLSWHRAFSDVTTYRHANHSENVARLGLVIPLK